MTGDWMTGDCYQMTGDWLMGDWMTGDWLTGAWLTGDRCLVDILWVLSAPILTHIVTTLMGLTSGSIALWGGVPI